jgi:glycosyltransferase involved in cell wall biosynthesis
MTTSPLTLWWFFQSQIRHLANSNFDVQTISAPGRELEECRANTGVPMHIIPMDRQMSPVADLISLARIWRLLRRLRPNIVHTHTPKAGLLGMVAATLAGVKARIYTVNGLVLMTRKGWRRQLLKFMERVACASATDVLCVSHSVRQVVLDLGVCPARKIRTLGYGGSHGVDLTKFNPEVRGANDRIIIRQRYGIPEDALLLAYIGRIVRDKGIEELALAWRALREEFPDLRLLMCGAFEAKDPVSPETVSFLRGDGRVHFTGGFVSDMPAFYAAIDVGVLPSHREGLPNVVLECAAMQVPIVATRIPGCVDSVQDGVTGLLVAPRDWIALTQGLRQLLSDPELRNRLGEAGRQFAAIHFSEKCVSERLAAEYRRLFRLPEIG